MSEQAGFFTELKRRHVYRVAVAYLVVEEERVPYVVRAGERPRMQVGGNPSAIEVLSAQPRRNLELIVAELPPGVTAGERRHYHHGEEVVLCLEGRVRLTPRGRLLSNDVFQEFLGLEAVRS